LSIEGLGQGSDGIDLANTLSKLTIANCVIRHFVDDAMYLRPTGRTTLSIIDTTAADNGRNGFNLSPSGAGEIVGIVDHSYAVSDGMNGIVAWGANTTGGMYITTSNDNFSSNGNAGAITHGTSQNAWLIAKEDVSDYNHYDYDAQTGSVIVMSHSEALAFVSPGSEVFVETGGLVETFGDNQIQFVNGALTPVSPQ
jgi:hypothetical protein